MCCGHHHSVVAALSALEEAGCVCMGLDPFHIALSALDMGCWERVARFNDATEYDHLRGRYCKDKLDFAQIGMSCNFWRR